MRVIFGRRSFRRRVTQLLLTFFIILGAAYPARGDDLLCAGGYWKLIGTPSYTVICSMNPCNTNSPAASCCTAGKTTTSAGNSKNDHDVHWQCVGGGCFSEGAYACECQDWIYEYKWVCCDSDGSTQACESSDGCPGSQTCSNGQWGACERKDTCCGDPDPCCQEKNKPGNVGH